MKNGSQHIIIFTEGEGGPMCGLDQKLIQEAGGSVLYFSAADQEDRIHQAAEAEVMVVSGAQITREMLTALPKLRGIVRLGIGVDTVDLKAATDLGVVVANVPDFCFHEVAEHTLALIFAVTRKIAFADRIARSGQWGPATNGRLKPMRRLDGQTLGLIGFGRIGQTLARKARGLGLNVIAHDPYIAATASQLDGVALLSLEELLPQTDILSLHVPLTPHTRGLVGSRVFELLKPGAILINTARGPVVNETALDAALSSGRLAGAGLDVLEQEPMQIPHPLTQFDNVVITCHYASLSTESYTNLCQQVSEQVVQIIQGQFPRHFVNPAVRTLPQCRLQNRQAELNASV
jgi:D-3-phosphoglycerate dehydrogenase